VATCLELQLPFTYKKLSQYAKVGHTYLIMLRRK